MTTVKAEELRKKISLGRLPLERSIQNIANLGAFREIRGLLSHAKSQARDFQTSPCRREAVPLDACSLHQGDVCDREMQFLLEAKYSG